MNNVASSMRWTVLCKPQGSKSKPARNAASTILRCVLNRIQRYGSKAMHVAATSMLKGMLNSLRKNALKSTMDAERPIRSAEQGTLKKLAEISFETLKPHWVTSNSTLWENCASHAANLKLGSSKVKGLLQATLFLSAPPRAKCKFRAYHDHHRHSMTI
jgi:hypothetical protein